MSNTTIASLADIANRLNDRVRNDIDPRLFLIANFKAPIDTPPSYSGKYYQYIQTLYRFAIDSSKIISAAYTDYLPKHIKQNNPRFEELNKSSATTALGLINLLRTYVDHNVVEETGWFDELKENNYNSWLSAVLGKDAPQDETDYEQLCTDLERRADRLVAALEAFVRYVGGLPAADKQRTVNRWIKDTVDWYASGTMRRDWYLGQMAKIYDAESVGYYDATRLNPRNARYILENWLREYYDRQPSCPQELQNALQQENGGGRRVNCATDCFFKYGYKRRLEETLRTHPSLSLLPQELMQQDIVDRLSDALAELLL